MRDSCNAHPRTGVSVSGPSAQVVGVAAQGQATLHVFQDEAVLRSSKLNGSQLAKTEAHNSDLVRAMGFSCCASRRALDQ